MAAPVSLAEFSGLIPAGAQAALPRGSLLAERLPGGRRVNLCLRIEDEQGRSVVLRVRRGPELAGADPARELACQQLAAAAGLAPTVLGADPAAGWVLMDYVAAAAWSPQRLQNAADLWRLGAVLRRLHAVPPPDFAPVDGLHLLQLHCAALAAHGQTDARALMERGSALTARLALLPRRPTVLCHGDPDVENFLGEAPLLVDFEYAQVADPTYDVALLLAYFPFLAAETDTLLAATGLDDPLSRRRLPLQLELCQVVNEAWARAQAALSTLD